MSEMKTHIFVKNPDRRKNTCWSCDAKKEDHEYFIHHALLEMPVIKTRKKSNARSVRTKAGRLRAVR